MLSLILATKGYRKNEIRRFLNSIQSTPNNLFEVLIICQDHDGYLDSLNEEYNINLKIIYSSPGLSKARNIGLKKAEGNLIGFPDDDCVYTPRLIHKIHEFFMKNSNVDCITFDVFDLNNKSKLSFVNIKRSKYLLTTEIMRGISSISLFHRKQENLFFDERFGIGGEYKSSEEFDYVINLIKKGKNVFYLDTLRVLHPDSSGYKSNTIINRTKINGIGHGAYLRKNKKSLPTYHIIEMILLRPIIRFVTHIFNLNAKGAYVSILLVRARLKGFFNYESE